MEKQTINGDVVRKGDTLITTEQVRHGDFKTVMARPDDYPPLDEGAEVEFEKIWHNFYGEWVRVKLSNGKTYDLREDTLKKK